MVSRQKLSLAVLQSHIPIRFPHDELRIFYILHFPIVTHYEHIRCVERCAFGNRNLVPGSEVYLTNLTLPNFKKKLVGTEVAGDGQISLSLVTLTIIKFLGIRQNTEAIYNIPVQYCTVLVL